MSTMDNLHSDLAHRQQEVREAEKAVEAAVRAEWKRKARAIRLEARQAKDAFLQAKLDFAAIESELSGYERDATQARADLAELDAEFAGLEFPLDEEEAAFEVAKQKLNRKLEALREPIFDAQQRKGQVLAVEHREAARYEQSRYAYGNAMARANGQRRSEVTGGVFSVR